MAIDIPSPTPERFHRVALPAATAVALRLRRAMRVDVCGVPVLLLWNDGAPAAFRDRCPHMGMPLSMGRTRGARVQCRYHGWAFDRRTGAVLEQPTLARPLPCALDALGARLWGPLVLVWFGGPGAEDAALSHIPEEPPPDGSTTSVEMDGPWPFALWNGVDYAHFAQHTAYAPLYHLYRRVRGDRHVPGTPFRWEPAGEDDRSISFVVPEAGRRLRLFSHTAIFTDEGGHHRFETWVLPQGRMKTRYFECFSTRDAGALRSMALHAAFWTSVAPLLWTEDRQWVGAAARAWSDGAPMRLSAQDRPLGAHLRRFVGAAP